MPPRRRTPPTPAIPSGDEPVGAASADAPDRRRRPPPPQLPAAAAVAERGPLPDRGPLPGRRVRHAARSRRWSARRFVVRRDRVPRGPRRRRRHGRAAPGRRLRRLDPDVASSAPGPLGGAGHRRPCSARRRTPSRPGATRSRPGGTGPRSSCPPGIDVELELEEGACVLDRAAQGHAARQGARAAEGRARRPARHRTRPAQARLAVALDPAVTALLERAPAARARHRVGRGARARRARARAVRRLVRVLPALGGRHARPAALGHVPRPPPSGCPPSRRWASTWSTCRRSTRSAARTARAATTRSTPGPGRPRRRRGRSARPSGGHDAVHPDLGTIEDFAHFVPAAAELGLEVALDFALQCSPDHPWVTEHPEWFTHRADGTHRLRREPAEEVPGHLPDRTSTTTSTASSPSASASCGTGWPRACGSSASTTRTPSRCTFWERLFARIHATDPDVLFLAEAFTRPAMMRMLGEVGFQQRYTYFTWRNDEVGARGVLPRAVRAARRLHAAQLLREHPGHPPDLPAVRRPGRLRDPRDPGRDAARPPGASTPASSSTSTSPCAPGREEYLDSEKFEYRPRDWAAAESPGTRSCRTSRCSTDPPRAPGAAHGCATCTSTASTTPR